MSINPPVKDWNMEQPFTRIATWIAGLAGRPLTFLIATLFIIIWGATGPLFDYSDTWQLVVNTSTTIVTFLMVFLIQNSQNSDASAIQAKLDELLRAVPRARPEFIGIEHLSDRELDGIREYLEKEVKGSDKNPKRGVPSKGRSGKSSEASLERLTKRV